MPFSQLPVSVIEPIKVNGRIFFPVTVCDSKCTANFYRYDNANRQLCKRPLVPEKQKNVSRSLFTESNVVQFFVKFYENSMSESEYIINTIEFLLILKKTFLQCLKFAGLFRNCDGFI